MPYNAEPGEVAYVVAGVALVSGDLACDQGFCGVSVKQKIPAADAARSTRANIEAGEAYILQIQDVVEAPRAGALAASVKGDLVWITEADNSLATAAAAGKFVLGKICSLPGERGTPSDKVRINLNIKV
jgi:hypothetical protein